MKYILYICFLLLVSNSFAQHKKNWSELGDKAFEQGDYYGASIYYDNARINDPSNLPLISKLAESLRLNNDYKKAEDYYKYIVLKDNENKYPLAIFWKAAMEKYNTKYSTSLLSWEIVKNKFTKDTLSYEYLKACQEIKSCNYAMRYAQSYQPIEIKNLGSAINTGEAEFGTWLQEDSILYFSSLRGQINEDMEVVSLDDYYIKIYRAKRQNNSWVNEGALDSIINHPSYHTGNGSFSTNGKTFYFSRCDLNLKCDLYKTSLVRYTWKPADIITELNDEKSTNTQPIVVTLDGVEVIFFVSNRTGGYGNNDIWYAVRKTDSTYTAPINLGPEINTSGNEISPFFDVYDSTFYFSSEWHEGFGGFDVFKAKLDLNKPMQVENIGQPINTSVNDFYFSVFGDKGFLTSNRPGSMGEKGLTCCNDLYELSFVDRKKEGFLTNKNNGLQSSNKPSITLTDVDRLNNLLPLSMYFDNDYPNPKTTIDTTQFSYDSLLINYKEKQEIFVKKAGKGLRGDIKTEAREAITSFFDVNVIRAEKKLASFLALLAELLNKGYQLNLMVRGYASPLADNDYNLQLTKRRIVSFRNMVMHYENGALIPYINGNAPNKGYLKLKALPFGEKMSLQTVSDNIDDKAHSIYSAEASKERKIDIVAVTSLQQQKLEPILQMDEITKDFGTVKSGEKVRIKFSFTNLGNATMVIKEFEIGCECIVPEIGKTTFQPGERGSLDVVFDSIGKLGRQFKTFSIITNSEKEPVHLSIIGLVN
jgi:hypothetical protein